MNPIRSVIFTCLACSLAASGWADEPAATRSEQLFVRRIAPLLREKCLGCHGAAPDEIEGSLDLRSFKTMMRGGDSGEPAVTLGKPEESPLLLASRRNDDNWSAMPPKEAEQLSPQQLAWLRDWIATGAAWPSAERSAQVATANAEKWSMEDVAVKTSGGLAPAWTHRKYDPDGLWAYQPLPSTSDFQGSPSIDDFISAALPDGLQTAPQASRRTLIRRATFDLTGLPPTPEEVQAFLTDPRTDAAAFATVVDRLLQSPHYGERMAQHWLDVVRYADSSGFANDYERGNAWRYRDYVVRSFNSDKPYDQFVREQIAGDEIADDASVGLIAVGFLRMGPWELTGMEVAKVARQRFLDDVTNSVGETFLGHSLQCARCHDHKFDPVPTRDYYSIQAVFATTQIAERKAPFLKDENTQGFEEQRWLDLRRQAYNQINAQLQAVLLKNAQVWFAEHPESKHKQAWDAAISKAQQAKNSNAFDTVRNQFRRQGIPEESFPPKLIGFTPTQHGLRRIASKGLQRLKWEMDRYQPIALSVYSGHTPKLTGVYAPLRVPGNRTAGELEASHILTGGDPFASGEPVTPGTLSVVDEYVSAKIPTALEGRRAQFADWVADPQNPLTSRVMVNRIWQWHFGEAIAGNPNNFGSTGARPTHPDLLDYLAATFVEEGWSIKQLHRRILLSQAYQRSTKHPHPEQLTKLDPLGKSLAVFRPRRLTAEELRDSMLAVTGELNPALGGIPCRPEINEEVAMQPRMVMGTFAPAWVPNPRPEQRHRRSIYALKLRGLMYPMLEVFNSPAPDFSCEKRGASTVTPQVFSLFNSESSYARGLALANRAWKDAADAPGDNRERAAIERCFQLALSRAPSTAEVQQLLEHWKKLEAALPPTARSTPVAPLKVKREAVEENTGERFRFEEQLFSNTEFQPDLQPSDVNRHIRALGDICLVILNSNEFVYVY